MDGWGWENLRPWLSERLELPAGPLFCVIDGPTRGRPWSAAADRGDHLDRARTPSTDDVGNGGRSALIDPDARARALT
jgi:hypothetical protein